MLRSQLSCQIHGFTAAPATGHKRERNRFSNDKGIGMGKEDKIQLFQVGMKKESVGIFLLLMLSLF